MIKKHGTNWRDEPGWHVVREWLHTETGLLAAITKHDEQGLLKADLFFPFDQGFEEDFQTPRWESLGGVEALFGPGDVEEAARHLEAAIRDRLPPATQS
jgi:hypothetical protein